MATYEGKSGQLYTTIEPCLGKGGEGAVYSIVRMPSFVLKVYAAGKATETRHRKLLAMLITKLPQSKWKICGLCNAKTEWGRRVKCNVFR